MTCDINTENLRCTLGHIGCKDSHISKECADIDVLFDDAFLEGNVIRCQRENGHAGKHMNFSISGRCLHQW